jgi:hypothetical protein
MYHVDALAHPITVAEALALLQGAISMAEARTQCLPETGIDDSESATGTISGQCGLPRHGGIAGGTGVATVTTSVVEVDQGHRDGTEVPHPDRVTAFRFPRGPHTKCQRSRSWRKRVCPKTLSSGLKMPSKTDGFASMSYG